MQVYKKKKAESLAAVIVSVFILSIALLGIMNIVGFSKNTTLNYEQEMFRHIVEGNSENLIKKMDFGTMGKNETFYIYKDTENKVFEVQTGPTNSGSRYIDKNGNKIDNIDENLGGTYIREFVYKDDILKHRLDPPEVPNLVFHFDGQNINENQNSNLADGTAIQVWNDVTDNDNNGLANNINTSPTFDLVGINGFSALEFDGVNDILRIPKDAEINNDDVCSTDLQYNQKSFAMVIKTGNDVTTEQAIYEQGGVATGYNFMIYDGDLYAGIHNRTLDNTRYSCYFGESLGPRPQDWDDFHKVKSVNLGEVLPNTVYYVTVVQDSSNFEENGDPIDDENKLKIFLNSELVLETNHVDPTPEHDVGALGGIYENNVAPWPSRSVRADGSHHDTINCTECNFFQGHIGEFISWNHALTRVEVRGIHNYLLQKWLGGKTNIKYSVVNPVVNKYISN